MKIKFIFVGRLDKEKGLLDIFECIDLLVQEGRGDKIEIDMFGKGVYSDLAAEYDKKYDFFTYHGFQKKEKVIEYRKDAHYTLMPSHFLETFGLSALDSLSLGVPVLGYQKGGLTQFIDDEFALEDNETISGGVLLEQLLKKLCKGFTVKKHKTQRKIARDIYAQYLRKDRYKHFGQLIKRGSKRILIVSDYRQDIGGIESWIHIMKNRLENEGFHIEFVGGIDHNPSKRMMFVNLFRTLFNFSSAYRINKKIKQYNPDLIWWHSVHRVLGWFPLFSARNARGVQRIMYHDFGLFHPFPSAVYQEQQLINAQTFKGFIKEGVKRSRLLFPLAIAKRLSIMSIRSIICKSISLHLVPSPYMLGVVKKKGFIGQKSALDVLPHFVE